MFDHEGAFRGWLVRVLIDEALHIRRTHRELDLNSKCPRPSVFVCEPHSTSGFPHRRCSQDSNSETTTYPYI
jgi:hypothetical protein